MGTPKRYVFAFIGALLGAVVLAGCSGDAVIEETTDQAAIEEGLHAWRTAAAEQAQADRAATINNGLKQLRQATVDHARLAAAAQLEQARAEARVESDALRAQTPVETNDGDAEIEQARAEARVEGDALRAATTAETVDDAAETERLRAKARVDGDALRLAGVE